MQLVTNGVGEANTVHLVETNENPQMATESHRQTTWSAPIQYLIAELEK